LGLAATLWDRSLAWAGALDDPDFDLDQGRGAHPVRFAANDPKRA